MYLEGSIASRVNGGKAGRLEAALGTLAVLFYVAHGVYHWFHGFPENLLWVCHLGALAVGVGLLTRSAALNGVGVLWLAVGTPLWLVGMVAGGQFVPTSLLTHLGGLTIGLWATTRLGLPRRTSWLAIAVALLLHLLSRVVVPPDKDVNLAHGTWKGLEQHFPSEGVFLASVILLCIVAFLLLERCLRSVLDRRGAPG